MPAACSFKTVSPPKKVMNIPARLQFNNNINTNKNSAILRKEKTMNKISSFCADHTKIIPGIYKARIDGDITTYDLRTRKPNSGDYMDNSTMHTFEHMFATYIRNSAIKDKVIYFGPMGCQTGFYLLIRNADDNESIKIIKSVLKQIKEHTGAVFGASEIECGNYRSLNLDTAKAEAEKFLGTVEKNSAVMYYN